MFRSLWSALRGLQKMSPVTQDCETPMSNHFGTSKCIRLRTIKGTFVVGTPKIWNKVKAQMHTLNQHKHCYARIALFSWHVNIHHPAASTATQTVCIFAFLSLCVPLLANHPHTSILPLTPEELTNGVLQQTALCSDTKWTPPLSPTQTNNTLSVICSKFNGKGQSEDKWLLLHESDGRKDAELQWPIVWANKLQNFYGQL